MPIAVIPAKAGIHALQMDSIWIPAFAGTTVLGIGATFAVMTVSLMQRRPDCPYS